MIFGVVQEPRVRIIDVVGVITVETVGLGWNGISERKGEGCL